MPENDEQDISEGAQAPVETERERFERERLSRRQALKQFGMTSAMATFALFSVDDLARMVGKAMQQRAADNKVVERVAKEFQQAGIALADGPSGGTGIGSATCQGCIDKKNSEYAFERMQLANCVDGCTETGPDPCGCVGYYNHNHQQTYYRAIACCVQYGCACNQPDD